jgi:hypothetical protein
MQQQIVTTNAAADCHSSPLLCMFAFENKAAVWQQTSSCIAHESKTHQY